MFSLCHGAEWALLTEDATRPSADTISRDNMDFYRNFAKEVGSLRSTAVWRATDPFTIHALRRKSLNTSVHRAYSACLVNLPFLQDAYMPRLGKNT